ncbi:MAG TPA: M10 family metallopeptidase C-terminal domain-containing protein [Allosphingosinicella sp.]|nr:M10 family metallopeptidase C-terminal domain-containing protein [Allosphingosinicella sp.]
MPMYSYTALLVGGAHGWHDGSGRIVYSFLQAIPDYYERADTNGDGAPDIARITEEDSLSLAARVAMSPAEKKLVQLGVEAWNEVANINLTLAEAGSVGDITFGAANFGDPGLYGFVPDFPGTLGQPSAHGDVWLNRGNPLQVGPYYGNTGWQTILHEIGHGLGLHHPHDDGEYADNGMTVMSYMSVGGLAEDPDTSWPVTPMQWDIEAVQQLYGPNLATRTGDTTYFGPALPGTGSAFELLDGALLANGLRAVLTIWDAGGNDTISAANQTRAVRIDLNNGSFSSLHPHALGLIAIASEVRIGGVVVNRIENAVGSAARDRLTGNDGANRLDGGAGADMMIGGAGSDIFVVDHVRDWASEEEAPGIDTIESSVNYGTTPGVENLVLTGAAVSGFGNALDNVISGNGADNLIDGRAGADTLRGGGGDDIYTVDQAGDRIIERAGEGADIVRALASYALGTGVEALVLEEGVVAGTGNALANLVTGNLSANKLNGGGGADTLQGEGGNDVLRGGAGGDILAGGEGADTIALLRASESTGAAFDTLSGFSFAEDLIDLPVAVAKTGESSGEPCPPQASTSI